MNNISVNELYAAFGQELKALRLNQNIGQEELSARASVSLNSVKNIERGRGATSGTIKLSLSNILEINRRFAHNVFK